MHVVYKGGGAATDRAASISAAAGSMIQFVGAARPGGDSAAGARADVPTTADRGFPASTPAFTSLYAPSAARRSSRALPANKIVGDPALKEASPMGDPSAISPERAADSCRQRTGRRIKRLNIKLD
jgi:hypothetical protein